MPTPNLVNASRCTANTNSGVAVSLSVGIIESVLGSIKLALSAMCVSPGL